MTFYRNALENPILLLKQLNASTVEIAFVYATVQNLFWTKINQN
jgi:hypothetical protein